MLSKNTSILITILWGVSSLCSAQTISKLNQTKINKVQLDSAIYKLTQEANVQGLGVVIFNHNQAIYQNTFGYKNITSKEPILPNTNFYGASLSKPVFAVMVMKLVEQGLLNLDKPLQQYLPQPIYAYKPSKKWHDNYEDLRTDTLYQLITARMCLSHTTGFPNWRWDEVDQKLRVHGTPGKRYSYSGEGLVYLQVVLEYYLQKPLEQLMKEYVFEPLQMKHSSYTWQAAFEKDYCVGHNSTSQVYEKDKDNDARSASTLETTLEDYTLFTQAVLNNKILSKSSTAEMFRLQISIKSIAQFGPMRLIDSTANDHIQLGYGLGWVVLNCAYGPAAFKEGHGDGFQHYTILFPQSGTGIILLSNSDNAESIFKPLLELCIADTCTPWQWENYIPYDYKKGK